MRARTKGRVRAPHSARIAFIDIETAPSLGYVWGKYQQDVIHFEAQWYMLSYSVKWAHEKRPRTYALCDFPLYKTQPENDRDLVKSLWKVLDEADLVVGHNVDRFDLRKSNARFIFHGLKPPTPYKTVDTLKVARRNFNFTSNKLDDLATMFGIGEKQQTGGFKLWLSCMRGDLRAWAKMKRYNAHDVVITERLYEQMLGWHGTHPNVLAISGANPKTEACAACASTHLQSRGWERRIQYEVHRFKCNDCGKFNYGERRRAQGVFLR